MNKPSWKHKLILLVVSGLPVLALLGIGEFYCRTFTRINFLDNSRGLFAAARYGKSYGNTPNFRGISFGEEFHTDESGFRFDPAFRASAAPDAPAILVIGDSVAFGPAVEDSLTITGRLRAALPAHRFYNAAAIGYDTFDYKNVAGSLVRQRPEIETVLLFFCLNDVNDASAQQIRAQTDTRGDPKGGKRSAVQQVNDFLRSRSKLYLWLKNVLVDTQLFYFRNDLAYYRMGPENLGAALRPLAELKQQLDAAGVSLKIFVPPYEAQLRPDGEPLEPQRALAAFFAAGGIDSYDLFHDFRQTGAQAHSMFLYGDPMHLSEDGHRLVAAAVCRTLPGCRM